MTENLLFPEVPVYHLNEDQENAKKVIVDYIFGELPEVDYITFEGYAGTGKTFTTNRIVEAILKINPRLKFGMTAPTHKAVSQLKKHSELKNELDFGTIHSFLGLKEVQKPSRKDPKKYVIRYEPDYDSKDTRRIDEIDVLFVDESSMLGDTLFNHIDDYKRSHKKLKVIFIGDPLQIPPVNDSEEAMVRDYVDAIPFVKAQQQSRRIKVVTLNTIVRQGAGNPIIAYATAIREQHRQRTIVHTLSENEQGGVAQIDRNLELFNNLIDTYFNSEEFKTDSDYIKIVAWRNDTVKYFNDTIRKRIYSNIENLPKIVIGEKLVFNKPLVKNKKILIPNNTEVEVKSFIHETVQVSYKLIDRGNAFANAGSDGVHSDDGSKLYSQEFRVYRCTVMLEDDKSTIIDIIHEEDENLYNALLKQVETCAKKCEDMFDRKDMWRQFYKLTAEFANVSYNYCITAHKALETGPCKTYLIDWKLLRALYTICNSNDYSTVKETKIGQSAAKRPNGMKVQRLSREGVHCISEDTLEKVGY